MVDVAQLAAETVRILSVALPTLKVLGGKAEEEFAGEAGKKLLGWLTGKMSSPAAKETLARAVEEPEKPRYMTALEGEIAGMAEDDAEFREELAKRVQEAGGRVEMQHAVVRGSGNRVVQVQGRGNKTSVR